MTFECLQELPDDLEWKVIYVGSAEDSNADQVLEEVMVGPVPVGINKFVLQAAAPDHSSIPQEDLVGVTVVLVTCSFMDQEFIRIGYYVNNEYPDYDQENPPAHIEVSKLYRSILADQPRVTRFNVDWTGKGGAQGMEDTMGVADGDGLGVAGAGDGADLLVDENDENEAAMEEDAEDEEDDEEDGDANEEVDLEDEEDEGDDEVSWNEAWRRDTTLLHLFFSLGEIPSFFPSSTFCVLFAKQDDGGGEGDEEDGAMHEEGEGGKTLENDESTMDVLKMKPQSSF